MCLMHKLILLPDGREYSFLLICLRMAHPSEQCHSCFHLCQGSHSLWHMPCTMVSSFSPLVCLSPCSGLCRTYPNIHWPLIQSLAHNRYLTCDSWRDEKMSLMMPLNRAPEIASLLLLCLKSEPYEQPPFSDPDLNFSLLS